MTFLLPQLHSHYSVLDSVLKPKTIIQEIESVYGGKGEIVAAITDYNSMAGIVQFIEAAESSSANIKPAMGFTATYMDGSEICLIARNKNGYHNILKLLSKVNSKDNYIQHPQISLEVLKSSDTSDIICIEGFRNSKLYNLLYDDASFSFELATNGVSKCCAYLDLLLKNFDKNLVFFSLEKYDLSKLAQHEYYMPYVKDLAKKYGIKTIYNNKVFTGVDFRQIMLHKIVSATKQKTTIDILDEQKIQSNILGIEEYDSSDDFASLIEKYNIFEPQKLPVFTNAEGLPSIEYLKNLCREQFKKRPEIRNNVYFDRMKSELEVFDKAGLSDYFLILRDVIQWTENQGHKINAGRGSSAGCLISYLLGITKIDPIKHGLLFSRFFNAGRIGSMPDIDTDFPKAIRDGAIRYAKSKYTKEYCGQIATFQTFMGKAALKAVFRANGGMAFTEMNEITKPIEDKSKISDELEDMKKEGLPYSVILWTLIHKPNKMRSWAYVDSISDDKKVTIKGDLAEEFEYAIELEGIKSAQSKHAAGVVISADRLEDKCPLLYDESSGEQVVGMEYEDAEKLGIVKYDFLSLSSLDRLADINK